VWTDRSVQRCWCCRLCFICWARAWRWGGCGDEGSVAVVIRVSRADAGGADPTPMVVFWRVLFLFVLCLTEVESGLVMRSGIAFVFTCLRCTKGTINLCGDVMRLNAGLSRA